MLYVPQSEKAVLHVGGEEFKDWTSIWVQRTWGNVYDQFKFSCAEREGESSSDVWSSLKFKPGEECYINLAGKRAITGMIMSRQVAYDANTRGVQIQGTSQTWAAATSSVDHEEKTGSLDGKRFKDIVDEILKPMKAEYEFKGNPPQDVFEYCQIEIGETVFAFFERLARNVNVTITCDENGKMVFICEGRQTGDQGELIEGKNILKMQCVVSIEQAYRQFVVLSQTNATDRDEIKYTKASQQKGSFDYPNETNIKVPDRILITPMEQAMTDKNTPKRRAENQSRWAVGSEINATVVVYSWTDGTGKLWEPGNTVYITSPMALLDKEKAIIQSVTYTQDNNGGSTSTLVCVSENALSGPRQFIEQSNPPPLTSEQRMPKANFWEP